MIYTSSPWGTPERERELFPGAVQVSTMSHGGIILTPDRWLELMMLYPMFRPWAGARYLEEDCDAMMVYLRWPQYFPTDIIESVLESVECLAGWKDPANDWGAILKQYRNLHPD